MEDAAKNAGLDQDLSHRLHHALTAGKEDLFRVMTDPSMDVVRAALRNPVLEDSHLLAVLERRDLSEEFLKAVSRLEIAAESHALKVAMVHNQAAPGSLLATLLPHLYLFELVTLCYLPEATQDQKMAAERVIIQRLPTTPLGNKLVLARRGTPAVVETLLREGDPRLMEACLSNPRLKEAVVTTVISGPNASPETISMAARHPRWKNRSTVQLAVLKNSRTPGVWFTLFLPHLNLKDVKNLKVSQRLTPAQKKLVRDELQRRGHY